MEELSVSVIIPTYNRSTLVVKAVDSALAAIRPGDEIIVVDDGSTDQTAAALAPYADRIRYILIPNGGAGAARNHGIQLATKPLIAFLDSDDEWMPDKLTLQVTVMQHHPEALACFTDFCSFRQPGLYCRNALLGWHRDVRDWSDILGPRAAYSTLAPLPSGRDDFYLYIGDLYPQELVTNYVATSTLMVRREAAGEALRFAEDMPTYEDWVCFGRLMRRGLMAYLECETIYYREHEGMRLGQVAASNHVSAHLMVIERVWGKDAQFQSTYADLYRKTAKSLHRWQAYLMLTQGKTGAAAHELRLAGSSPVIHTIVARMPPRFARWLIQHYHPTKRFIRSALHTVKSRRLYAQIRKPGPR